MCSISASILWSFNCLIFFSIFSSKGSVFSSPSSLASYHRLKYESLSPSAKSLALYHRWSDALFQTRATLALYHRWSNATVSPALPPFALYNWLRHVPLSSLALHSWWSHATSSFIPLIACVIYDWWIHGLFSSPLFWIPSYYFLSLKSYSAVQAAMVGTARTTARRRWPRQTPLTS